MASVKADVSGRFWCNLTYIKLPHLFNLSPAVLSDVNQSINLHGDICTLEMHLHAAAASHLHLFLQ